MFGRSETRFPEISELQRGVRTLDRVLSRLSETVQGAREAASNSLPVDGFGDVAERFRDGAERVGREAMRMGRRASALGEMSIDRFAKDVGVHPLMLLGAAIGIGAIIGAARYRHTLLSPPPPPRKRRVAARKGNRK